MGTVDLFRHLPAVIKRLRLSTGQSQKELGQKIGLNRKTIGGYELGTISPPLDKLGAILELTGVVGIELVQEDGGRTPLGEFTVPNASEESLRDLRLRIGLKLVEDVLGKDALRDALTEEQKRVSDSRS